MFRLTTRQFPTEGNVIRVKNGVAIHGGVGTIPADDMTADMAAAYRETLRQSLLAGHAALQGGGSSVDAVAEAVAVMEDSPLFNAGRGSNLDEHGVVTMDASIMRGSDLDAGAIAGVTDVRNPITLARLVMERSPHLFLIGGGAEAFARAQGIPSTENSWFHTERRIAELHRARERGGARPAEVLGDVNPIDQAGTVGAVAIDASGTLAAATSTGGMANKTAGRVGDSPIIGAGTYASDLCAVSCTGWGEYFIRNAAAFDVHARMRHAGVSLDAATHGVIFETLGAQVPRSGGMVAMDAHGHVDFCFNTPGMYRGWVNEHGTVSVGIYAGD
jgi:L-asparaginase / beta-aspartyl-peptidase